jgi:hypothetical protein
MSALANGFGCSECERLVSQTAELEAQIAEARAQLEQAIEAADGTSARRYDALQHLIKAEERVASEMQAHGRHGYVAEVELTHSTIEA